MAAPYICQEQRRSMRLKLRVSKPPAETPPRAQRTVLLRCDESKLQTNKVQPLSSSLLCPKQITTSTKSASKLRIR
ncbi:hypothetical protein HanRHA438_Chr17g0841861 [Helianthus annuus]|nr:hypothetical protein HanRHA438_Chr17g0841861 [Helianthus annuus]